MRRRFWTSNSKWCALLYASAAKKRPRNGFLLEAWRLLLVFFIDCLHDMCICTTSGRLGCARFVFER